MTGDEVGSSALTNAWAQHRVWSQVASALKGRIRRARRAAFGLAGAAAVLAVASGQMAGASTMAGQGLAGGAAVAAGLSTLVQRRLGSDALRSWTRSRSASEALKSEVYSFLAGGGAYGAGVHREHALQRATREILASVSDLQRHTIAVRPDGAPLPPVQDVGSYIAHRLLGQVRDYYVPWASRFELAVRRYRRLGTALGVVAIALAGASVALETPELSAWVPVVTTIAASVAAYVAANRFDFLVIEYLRTAQRLEHLREEYSTATGETDGERTARAARFVDACEGAISVENQAWMARLDQPVALAP